MCDEDLKKFKFGGSDGAVMMLESGAEEEEESEGKGGEAPVGFKIKVKNAETGETFTLEVKPGDSIDIVKAMIEFEEGVPVDQQRIVFAGMVMEDGGRTLFACGIQKDATLHVVPRKKKLQVGKKAAAAQPEGGLAMVPLGNSEGTGRRIREDGDGPQPQAQPQPKPQPKRDEDLGCFGGADGAEPMLESEGEDEDDEDEEEEEGEGEEEEGEGEGEEEEGEGEGEAGTDSQSLASRVAPPNGVCLVQPCAPPVNRKGKGKGKGIGKGNTAELPPGDESATEDEEGDENEENEENEEGIAEYGLCEACHQSGTGWTIHNVLDSNGTRDMQGLKKHYSASHSGQEAEIHGQRLPMTGAQLAAWVDKHEREGKLQGGRALSHLRDKVKNALIDDSKLKAKLKAKLKLKDKQVAASGPVAGRASAAASVSVSSAQSSHKPKPQAASSSAQSEAEDEDMEHSEEDDDDDEENDESIAEYGLCEACHQSGTGWTIHNVLRSDGTNDMCGLKQHYSAAHPGQEAKIHGQRLPRSKFVLTSSTSCEPSTKDDRQTLVL